MSGLLPALGGGANGVVQLAAGGLSGVLAMSALIAAGVVPVGGTAPAGSQDLLVSACQGKGHLAVARPGEHMLVTGKSADGVYFRVHVPGPPGEGWVRSADVNLLADGSVLPVAFCGEVADATGTPGPTATLGPTATATARVTAKPTARPTAPPTQAVPATAAPTAKPAPTPNLGPVFTTQPYSSAATMGTNPLGTGTCVFPEVIALTAGISDPDGVALVQLWVQKPGATSFVRLSHGFSKDGSLWHASISTKADGLTIEGKLDYYAIAFDSKGAQTRSKTASVQIERCDTEATISGGIQLPISSTTGYYWLTDCDPFSIPWAYTLSDRDGLVGATLTYSITDRETSATLGPTTLNLIRYKITPNPWRISSIPPKDGSPFLGLNTVRFWVTTTDKYGGTTTTSRKQAKTVQYYNCVE